jgi:HEAT repeat protein
VSSESAAIRLLLEHEEPESRRLGTQQISYLRGDDATELLLIALADDDWRVRKEAAGVAAALESRDEVLRALVAAIGEKENIGLRNAAVEALVAIGADSVPATIDAMVMLDADGRKLAVEVLAGVPDSKGTGVLVQSLADPDPNVRCGAAEALGNASAAGQTARGQAVDALARALQEGDQIVQLAALDALARLGARLRWADLEPLASDPVLRRHALAAAARSQERDAVVALAAATADRSLAVSTDALVALVECVLLEGGDPSLIEAARLVLQGSPTSCERIRFHARGSVARVRGAALAALGLVRDPADIPLLALALADEEVALDAEAGLRLYGKDAVAALLEAGRTSTLPLRAATISLVPVLTRTSDRPTLDALHDALQDPSPDVVAAALASIGATGGEGDLERVAPFAKHFDTRVARTACAAVRSLTAQHRSEAKALRARLDATGSDAALGCVLLGALAETGAGARLDEGDLAFLRAAAAHESAGTRRAAVEALAAVGGPVAAEIVTLSLADEEAEVSAAAVRALGRMGLAEPLAELVRTAHDAGLVATALRALAEADPAAASEAARPLVRAADPVVACAAVQALGRLPSPRREDALFEALEHRDAEVVKAALFELSPASDARSLSRFGLCLDHESWEVRRVAAELLGHKGGPEARPLLRARLEREKDALVREALGLALGARPASREAD